MCGLEIPKLIIRKNKRKKRLPIVHGALFLLSQERKQPTNRCGKSLRDCIISEMMSGILPYRNFLLPKGLFVILKRRESQTSGESYLCTDSEQIVTMTTRKYSQKIFLT